MAGGRRASSGTTGGSPGNEESRRATRGVPGGVLGLAFPLLLLLLASPAQSASNKVRISNIGDIAFGTIASVSSDAVQSQSLCVYADTATTGYNVRASGSGAGGAFTLASGSDTLPFEVQWSSSAGQSSGTELTANVALSAQLSSATQQNCNAGPAASASLIVILPAAALSSVAAGPYNGSLSLIIGPE